MFAKHDFDRIGTVARDARLSVAVTRSRNLLTAVWRVDPVSGRLQLRWHAVGRPHDNDGLPGNQRPASQPDAQSTRRPTTTATATQLIQEAAA